MLLIQLKILLDYHQLSNCVWHGKTRYLIYWRRKGACQVSAYAGSLVGLLCGKGERPLRSNYPILHSIHLR